MPHTVRSSEMKILGKILRFGVSGAGTTALYIILVNLLVSLSILKPIVASVGAYIICIVASYFLQSRYTFQSSANTRIQIVKFCFVSLVGLAISTVVMTWAVAVKDLPYWLSALVVAGAISVGNFFALLGWVFVRR
jgi:putative flippase GtrA